MNPNKTRFGATAMALASALRVLVQIAVLPIIGRILGPHAYGEVALVTPFVFFSMMLAESGLGACIVRAETVTRDLEGTVFCFSAGLGLFFMVLFAAIAYPLGRFMDEPDFPKLLMGMSSILLLASFNIVPASLLLRDKKYHWIAASDVASSVGGLAGVILGISLGWGAWSLVAQQIGLWVAKLAVIYTGQRTWPLFIFKVSILRENMRFGSQLTGSSIISFIARNIDNVLIGKVMGPVVLGYYALAFQIVGIPQMVLAGSIYFTVFAGTAQAVRDGISPMPQFLAVLKGAALVCVPVVAGLAATANLSVPLVLGDKWGPTVDLIILLSVFGLAQTLGTAMTGMLNGLGKTGIQMKINGLSALAIIFAIVGGVFFNSAAVAVGVSITSLLNPIASAIALKRVAALRYGDIFAVLKVPFAASIIMGIGVCILQFILPVDLPPVVTLTICILAGIVLYVGTLIGLFRDHFAADLALAKRVLRRGAPV